jgi:hypothetical protein
LVAWYKCSIFRIDHATICIIISPCYSGQSIVADMSPCWWCISVSNFVWIASGQILRRSQGTLLPLSLNPRYRICGTNVWCKNQSIKAEST